MRVSAEFESHFVLQLSPWGRQHMRFSEYFGLGDVKEEEWFDPILSIDTNLFVDPFLIYDNERGLFVGSHAEIIGIFDTIFRLIAESGGDQKSPAWRRAHRLVFFPEVAELCLGYTGSGTTGSGSGAEVATDISESIWIAIRQGIVSLRHFEEVQIFDRGIGPDRISDATTGMLRHRFASYTAAICVERGIPTQQVVYDRARFDPELGRWVAHEYALPINPYNNRPILLSPKRYLRPLPTINAPDFWRHCFDRHSDELRSMFGEDITSNIAKEAIIELARRHPEYREEYVRTKEAEGAEPYDFYNDPAGQVLWYESTQNWAREHPVALGFSNPEEFNAFLTRIIAEFRNFVENNGGWSLLWNENETPKRELASQLLFLGIVKHYCAANNVDVSKEVNIGRGPVDFKVASGYTCRALIELKLAKNTKFWQGLERQLPKYMEAEDIRDGRFVVIVLTDSDTTKIAGIEARVAELNTQANYSIVCEVIDAERDSESASKL